MKWTARAAAGFLVVEGITLMAAPSLGQFPEPVADSLRAAGPVLAAAGYVSLHAITHSVRWLALPVGLWLLAAPLIVPHRPLSAAVISLAAGAITTVLLLIPVWDRRADRKFGGGWRALRQ